MNESTSNPTKGLKILILFFSSLFFGYHGSINFVHLKPQIIISITWMVYFICAFVFFFNRIQRYEFTENTVKRVLITLHDCFFLLSSWLITTVGVGNVIKNETEFNSSLPKILSFLWAIFIFYLFFKSVKEVE